MFWLAVAAFVLAIAVNCVSVYAQKHYRAYDRFGRWAWPAHIALLCAVWGAAVAAMILVPIVAPDPSWPLPTWVRPIGLVVGVLASVIFGLAIRELGVQSLFNGNFFGYERYASGGIYGLLDDPMYIAYTLSFVALAFRQADAVYLLLALVSVVGLNVVEARVERVDAPAEHAPAPRSEP